MGSMSEGRGRRLACWALVSCFLSACAGSAGQLGVPLGATPVDAKLVDLSTATERRVYIAVLTSEPTTLARGLPNPSFPADSAGVLLFRVGPDGRLWRESEVVLYREVLFVLRDVSGYIAAVQKQALAAREPAHLIVYGHKTAGADRLLVVSNRFGGVYELSGTSLTSVQLLNSGTFVNTRVLSDLLLAVGESSLAVVDLNQDGNNDFVLVRAEAREVVALRGDGSGNAALMVPPGQIQMGGRGDEPRFVSSSLLTQYRGYPPAAFVVGRGGVLSDAMQIVACRWDGKFVIGAEIAAGAKPRSAVWGDFNNDMRPDLVVAGVGGLGFFEGTGVSPEGVPLFAERRSVGEVSTPNDRVMPVGMAVLDYDGDGKLDLAVANFGGRSVDIWHGGGDGTFSRVQEISFGASSQPRALAVGDLNGDGLTDLVVVSQGTDELSIVLNRGALGFVVAEVPHLVPGRLFVLAEFDGSPGSDLVTTYYVEEALADRTSSKAETALGVAIPYVESVVVTHSRVGVQRIFPTMGTSPAPEVIRYSQLVLTELQAAIAAGTFTDQQARAGNLLVGAVQLGTTATTAPAIAVVRGGTLIVDWESDAARKTTVGSLAPPGQAAPYYPTKLTLGDLDGDGIAEIIFLDQAQRTIVAGKLWVVGPNRAPWNWRPTEIGTILQLYRLHSFPAGEHRVPVGLAVGDFIASSPGAEIAVLNRRSNTADVLEVTHDAARGRDNVLQGRIVGWGTLGIAPGEAVALDLNADGLLDLVVTGAESNDLALLIRNALPSGEPSAVLFSTALFRHERLDGPIAPAVADLDGDGTLELLVGARGSQSIAVFKPRAGTLDLLMSISTHGSPYNIAVGDLNGDGSIDIAAVSGAGLGIYLGKGDGTLLPPFLVPPSTLGGLPHWVGVGDVNADGAADVLVAIAEPGKLLWSGQNLDVWVRFGPITEP